MKTIICIIIIGIVCILAVVDMAEAKDNKSVATTTAWQRPPVTTSAATPIILPTEFWKGYLDLYRRLNRAIYVACGPDPSGGWFEGQYFGPS